MSLETITTISPVTNKPILTRNGVSDADLASIPEAAVRAFESYRRTSFADRQKIVKKALTLLGERQDALGKELTEQMGRPIAYTPKEVSTAVLRGQYLLKISEDALKDTEGEAEKGFRRFIKKVPVGPVLILFPWNVRVASNHSTVPRTDCYPVSVSDPRELPRASVVGRQLGDYQAIATDANECRANPTHLQRCGAP